MTKILIFDASTLISLAINGLFNEIKELKENFDGKFLITKEVYYEIIEKPISSKKFELEALRLKELVDKNVLEFPSVMGVENKEISKDTSEILYLANNAFLYGDKPIHLIDIGEASVLALVNILSSKENEIVIGIDERTTRMICEGVNKLAELLEKKLHTKIRIKKENLKFIKKYPVLRSSELVYIIWKKQLITINDPRTLDALLYAVKLKGCSISDEEIKEIKKLG